MIGSLSDVLRKDASVLVSLFELSVAEFVLLSLSRAMASSLRSMGTVLACIVGNCIRIETVFVSLVCSGPTGS